MNIKKTYKYIEENWEVLLKSLSKKIGIYSSNMKTWKKLICTNLTVFNELPVHLGRTVWRCQFEWIQEDQDSYIISYTRRNFEEADSWD